MDNDVKFLLRQIADGLNNIAEAIREHAKAVGDFETPANKLASAVDDGCDSLALAMGDIEVALSNLEREEK
jgi:hypothetical protein